MALLAVFGLRTLYLSVKPLPRIELSEKELRLLGVSPSHAPQKKSDARSTKSNAVGTVLVAD